MKIIAIDSWLHSIPMRGAFRGGHGERTRQDGVAVRIRTGSGLEGAGNVDPNKGYGSFSAQECHEILRDRLAPALIGRPADSIRALTGTMDKLAPEACEAQAAIEMALLDLNGKALGVPAHRLLGGAVRDTVYLNGWIGMLPPEEAAQAARDFSIQGFRSVKIKVGDGVEADRDRVAAVREAAPQIAIRIDANESLQADTSIELAKAISRHDITLFEQPVPRDDLDGMKRVRKAIDFPVMADESIYDPASMMAVIKKECADIIKVKVMKQGGLLRTLQAIETAAAAGIRCTIGHGFGLTLHTLAEVHVAAVSTNLLEACECVGPLKMTGDIVEDPIVLAGGSVPVPTAPGLGATLDEAALARFAFVG
ncbi:MAG: hypothetical protein O6934_13375 [SAR324 cluster bacterium]|nr:hypothetical protein [SAR324 cluster bacterium]